MIKALKTVAAISAVALLAGCAHSPCRGSGCKSYVLSEPISSDDVGQLIYSATDLMDLRTAGLRHDRPILVATIVSQEDLQSSSTFGRLASQLVANKLSQKGYLVRDATYLRAWTVKPGTGSLVLSEDAARASQSVNAQAVVAGTYVVAGRQIILSLRLLSATDGEILSSSDVTIPLNHNTETMVQLAASPARPTTYPMDERMPARQYGR